MYTSAGLLTNLAFTLSVHSHKCSFAGEWQACHSFLFRGIIIWEAGLIPGQFHEGRRLRLPMPRRVNDLLTASL